jgi:aquaporin-4
MNRSELLVRFRMATSIDDLKSVFFWRSVIAEALGTLLLIFVGCGSCLSWEDPNRIPKSDYNPVVQIAFCFGISVATIVWGIGHVSGGHINPAVTSAFFITRRISFAKAIFYIAAQCIGAIFGALILKGVTPYQRWGTLGNTMLNDEMEVGRAFGVEFMITFVLVFTVFASCDGKRNDLKGSAPLTIGLSVTMCHLFAVSKT